MSSENEPGRSDDPWPPRSHATLASVIEQERYFCALKSMLTASEIFVMKGRCPHVSTALAKIARLFTRAPGYRSDFLKAFLRHTLTQMLDKLATELAAMKSSEKPGQQVALLPVLSEVRGRLHRSGSQLRASPAVPVGDE